MAGLPTTLWKGTAVIGAVVIAATVAHELTHVALDYLADGIVGVCESSGLPVKLADAQLRTCVGGETFTGPGAVLGPLVGAAVGLGAIALAVRDRGGDLSLRAAAVIAGAWVWLLNVAYLAGVPGIAPDVQGVRNHDGAVAASVYGADLSLIIVGFAVASGLLLWAAWTEGVPWMHSKRRIWGEPA